MHPHQKVKDESMLKRTEGEIFKKRRIFFEEGESGIREKSRTGRKEERVKEGREKRRSEKAGTRN